MKVPVSWLKDFVDIDIPLEDLAHRLTMAGLEVEEIRIVGLPMPPGEKHEFKIEGLAWPPDKIVVGAIHEVTSHPNADRLVLCRLTDGEQEHTVLAGAPNLFPYKDQGPLDAPLKVAYAREGTRLYNGHEAGQVLMTLKRMKIRSVESYSMVCSEKELGISNEHEGVIILDQDAPVGAPLADVLGDAVLDIAITPNIARDANILGVAREVAALTGKELRPPDLSVQFEGPAIEGEVSIVIENPEWNPRFVLGLIRDVEIKPSPYWVQHRLRLSGMRPINNIVDVTNYVMWELGQPLHAFDYEVLLERAQGEAPTILTRTAQPGETLVTLDDVERELDDFTVLVCDTEGPLSIAGIMGGAASEVSEETRHVLLEGAAWNFINVRRTVAAQRLPSEASYRFSRGVHPAQAERGVRRGLEFMRQWSDGKVSEGLVDEYPLPPVDPEVAITLEDVRRMLGISLTSQQIGEILTALDFQCTIEGEEVIARTPDHRLDIGEGVTGKADLLEEIARIYGYDQIPQTRLADALPPQRPNRPVEREERLRDVLVKFGLQEVITYRLTSPDRERRILPPGMEPPEVPYVWLQNPIASDRTVMRRSLLASVLESAENSAHLSESLGLFEIGPVYLPVSGAELPEEPLKLVIVLTGMAHLPAWDRQGVSQADFYDLKGVIEAMLSDLQLADIEYEPARFATFHPGKCAELRVGGSAVGVFGELHPLVRQQYGLENISVLAAQLNADTILAKVAERQDLEPVPMFPPILEDLAVVVAEEIPASHVAKVISEGGGGMLSQVQLFDVYRGEQIGAGRKSLAYSLTYQAPDRTLTDKEVAKARRRIVRKLEEDLDARLRS